MFKRKPNVWMAVHEEDLVWLSTDSSDMGRTIFQLPLEEVLKGGLATAAVPDGLKGNNRFLCLVPDHWFGMESYPFKSSKPSLIEAFLERKLAASRPGQKSITQFFNYQCNLAKDGQEALYAHFLQEEKAFRFNRALCGANLAPLGYTTPAFLWEETLRKSSRAFADKGSLLAHISRRQGRLYFYFNGIYQFSRVVVLPEDDPERIGAITYEINQSLYLFSQKTKSELGRIYLYPDAPALRQALTEGLGREVADCEALRAANQCAITFSEVPALCGLLNMSPPAGATSVFSVIHRRIKRQLEWRPVQRMGIAVGLLLVLLLTGEAFFLGNKQHQAETEQRNLQQQIRTATRAELPDYTLAFDQVLQRLQQPSSAETVLRVLAGLPGNVRLHDVDLALDAPPRLAVSALVEARDTDHLRTTLTELVGNMQTTFEIARGLSINDIDVGATPDASPGALSRFTIAFQLELD